MMVPTLKVLGGSKGTRIINADDFDPAIHELADGVPVRSVTVSASASKPPRAKKPKP
jgi:hypothetical protein